MKSDFRPVTWTLISCAHTCHFFLAKWQRAAASSGSAPAAAAEQPPHETPSIAFSSEWVFRRAPLPADWARGVLARCASARRQCRPRHTAVSARASVCQCFIIPTSQSDRVSGGDGPCAANTTRHRSCTSRCPAAESAASSESALGRGRTVANFAQGRQASGVFLANLLIRACKFRFDAERIKRKLRECSSTNRRRRRIGMSRLFVRSAQRTRSAVDRLCFSCVPMHTNHTLAVSRRQGERASEKAGSLRSSRAPPASSSVYAQHTAHPLFGLFRPGNLQA
jgi:hypothetical protein